MPRQIGKPPKLTRWCGILPKFYREGSMPVARRIRDVLGAKASAAFAGREAELRCLADWAHSREPVAITWIHGLAGIGKTAL